MGNGEQEARVPAFRSQLLESYAKHFDLPHNYVQQLKVSL